MTAVLLGLAAGAVRRLGRLEIVGDSMRPTLEPGDRVLVVRGPRPRRGDLVALRDPRGADRTMVKRVAARPGDVVPPGAGLRPAAGTGYVVLGDNTAFTTDSRHFGPVGIQHIRGVVVYRYFPPERRGRLVLTARRRAGGAPARSVEIWK